MIHICELCGENQVEHPKSLCGKCSPEWACAYPGCDSPSDFICEYCEDVFCENHIAENAGTLICDWCRESAYYDYYDEFLTNDDEFVEAGVSLTTTATKTKKTNVELPLEFDATLPLIEVDQKVGSVTFSRETWDFLRALHSRFSDVEFGAYLYGKKLSDAEFVVEKVYIPKQKVDAASVDFEELPPGEYEGLEFLGTYHSHNRMKVFASGTDDAYLLSQFTVNVIGNNAGEAIGFVSGDYELFGKQYRLAARITVYVEKVDVPQDVISKITRRAFTLYSAVSKTKNVKKKSKK